MASENYSGVKTNRLFLPDGATFRFACHSSVECFTRCCRNADMFLYPYDIIRLKQRLGITSEDFLARHTITAFRDNPDFPNVMLKMTDQPGHPCPFLSENGCSVYPDRPYSCRAYPLEPAMFGTGDNQLEISCHLVHHNYCLGHEGNTEWSAVQWLKNQQMEEYNAINAKWAQVYGLFQNHPFGAEPAQSPALKMASMASYNMDGFRRFVFDSSFLSRFHVPPERLEAVKNNETELLLLGFDWIRRFLSNQGPLMKKQSTG